MVVAVFDPYFQTVFSKLKNPVLKDRIIKKITKLRENPELGKPMRNVRKGTREVYIPPFRLSYAYIKEENKIVVLDFYHKDKQ